MIPRQQKRSVQVLLCTALSLLLHVLLAWLILLIPAPRKALHPVSQPKARPLRVLRSSTRHKPEEQKKPEADPLEKPTPREQKATVKTSADTPEALPDQPDYEGRRSSRAASAPDARHRTSSQQAPAMEGAEKEEIVTFDQERQEGSLEHDGKQQTAGVPVNTPPVPPVQAHPAAMPAGRADTPEPDQQGQDERTARRPATEGLTQREAENSPLQLRQEESGKSPGEEEQQAARQGQPEGSPHPAARPRPVFFDPSLAQWAQPQKPGFRTTERRSRSHGRFIFGRGAALNVVSTPRGAYEALVYRRVAHFWYIACDDHRGDIIPGKITISLRINRRGQIDSMALIRRSGASISQQSFTFKAIRQASLPPMPPEVQADVIGELMELIFEFNFD